MPAKFIPCVCGRKPCTRKELTKRIQQSSQNFSYSKKTMTEINEICLKSKSPLAVIGENATLVHFEDLHCQEGKESKEETQCHSGEPGGTDMLMTPGHEVNSNPRDPPSDQPVPASFSVFSQSLDNPNAMSGYSSGMSPNGKCKSADVPEIYNPVSAGDDVKSLMQGLRDEVNPVVSHPLGGISWIH